MNIETFNAGVREACDEPSQYQARVGQARQQLLAPGVLQDLAELFRVLGDPMRLQVIHLLVHGELCVCDLAELLGAAQSAVSNHLRVLRAHKMVKTRKEGKLVFYSLCEFGFERVLVAGLSASQEVGR